ncbi:amyloid beta precursor protein binding family B member 1 isoform X1 [Athene noctua]|uniref:amyloid beta precursor protein binding family B member 1 isoform X1 n=1 Tax=Athene noctua TaxID=126797 RepID=UPI003EB787EC
MSGSLSKRSDNDNNCLGLSLALPGPPELLPPEGPPGSPQGPPLYGSTEGQGGGGPGAPSGEEPANAKWVKEGQNQRRRAAGRDQNRNELGPPPEELGVAARNARNAGGGGALPLLIDLRGPREEEEDEEEEEEDEDEEEEEEDEEEEDDDDGDSTPVQSDPTTGESEPSGERGPPREHGRSASASLLFGGRGPGPGSDEDSSWATLSQGSPAGSSPDDADSFWTRNSFETDSDLPAGWMRVQDTSGTYYWHIPTGTTQWEPPPGLARASGPPSPGGNPPAEEPPLSWTGFAPAERFGEGGFWKDPAAEEAQDEPGARDQEPPSPGLSSPGGGTAGAEEDKPGCKRFAVRSLGWVEMSEDELAPGRSSVAVNNCIRQLCLHQRGPPGEGRAMLLLLENQTLKLVDPQDRALLHAQPVAGIRVWGVGRDSGRDFAYVARDQLTQMLKCHVFRCESPAKNVATSLHEVCSQIMAERRSARAGANGLCTDPSRLVEIPFQAPCPPVPSGVPGAQVRGGAEIPRLLPGLRPRRQTRGHGRDQRGAGGGAGRRRPGALDPHRGQRGPRHPHHHPPAERGGAVRVPRAVPLLHGRGPGRPLLRLHHGQRARRLPLPHGLVRAQRRGAQRGAAGRLHAALPEVPGRAATGLQLLPARAAGRLGGPPGGLLGPPRRPDPPGQPQAPAPRRPDALSAGRPARGGQPWSPPFPSPPPRGRRRRRGAGG